MSTVLPIWVTDSFKPAGAWLIEGETELLPGLDIVRKLYITVDFGGDHFTVGRGELEMVTYNEKHHWVFPLAPTACANTKLNEYFGQMQKSKILVLKAQGDFWGHLEVRKVAKSKSQRLQ